MVDTATNLELDGACVHDCDVNIAVDLSMQNGEGGGVVIGVFIDGVDIADSALDDDDDFLFEEIMSMADSDYWEMEEDELVELVEMQPDNLQAPLAQAETQMAAAAGYTNAPEQPIAPAASPFPKSRRIIGRVVRGPAAEERAAELRAQGMTRSRSLTILAKKRPKGASETPFTSSIPFSLEASGEALFGETSASAPWAVPWSPQMAARSPAKTFVLQGGGGQLARALSTSALSLDLGPRNENTPAAPVDAWKSWAAPTRPPSTATYTFQKAKQGPATLSRHGGKQGYMLSSLSPDLHVAMTGSKRGNIVF